MDKVAANMHFFPRRQRQGLYIGLVAKISDMTQNNQQQKLSDHLLYCLFSDGLRKGRS